MIAFDAAVADVRRALDRWQVDQSPEALQDLVTACEWVVQVAPRPATPDGRSIAWVIVGAVVVVLAGLLAVLLLGGAL